MMKKILVGFCILFCISCSSKQDIPSGIIEPEKMKAILWDVVRAQFLAHERAQKDTLSTESLETKILTAKVFRIHNITAEKFDKSYAWYVKNPEVMSVFVDSLYTQKQREARPPVEDKAIPQPLDNKKIRNE
ncbi:MAG: DUF4296 domain-containing protein [Ginsengibacter sp.]